MTSKRRENINLVSFICLSFFFSNGLLWTVGLTLEIKLSIQFS